MMSKFLKLPVLALTLASFVFVAPLQAMAGQKHHNKYHNYNKHSYKHKKHYKQYYYGSGYDRHHYNYQRSHRHGNGGAIALGVLTGGLLFYALSNNNRRNNNVTYVQQAPVNVPPQQQTWVQPAPVPQSSCLQVREYTTTVEVGGKTVPAYGEACLQPDGSWKFGQPIAEPGN